MRRSWYSCYIFNTLPHFSLCVKSCFWALGYRTEQATLHSFIFSMFKLTVGACFSPFAWKTQLPAAWCACCIWHLLRCLLFRFSGLVFKIYCQCNAVWQTHLCFGYLEITRNTLTHLKHPLKHFHTCIVLFSIFFLFSTNTMKRPKPCICPSQYFLTFLPFLWPSAPSSRSHWQRKSFKTAHKYIVLFF